MILPPEHPFRVIVNDEVHARPAEPLTTPSRISFLAVLTDGKQTWQDDRRQLAELVEPFGQGPPESEVNYLNMDLGPFRVRWERHTEFSRYQFTAEGSDPTFANPAIGLVPERWLSLLTGQTIAAAHAAVIHTTEAAGDHEAISQASFGGNYIVGSAVAGGAGQAFADFRIHPDGFSRVLVHDFDLTPRQAGRTIQRLLEIDTYRVLALLALPVARELAPKLLGGEVELADILHTLADVDDGNEAHLLNRLTLLEANLNKNSSKENFRFAAATAYYDLVRQRIVDLREVRLTGLQTFQEFTERRLGPAMKTCAAVARRQETLSVQLARATQLLSTRVGVSREAQNQALLESMDRRAKLHLRLQQTVEWLSVAAVTYYVVGLVGYGAKGLSRLKPGIDTDLVTALSIPIVIVVIIAGLRRLRLLFAADEK
jgi:uncharacterized membrane-anchored protein